MEGLLSVILAVLSEVNKDSLECLKMFHITAIAHYLF